MNNLQGPTLADLAGERRIRKLEDTRLNIQENILAALDKIACIDHEIIDEKKKIGLIDTLTGIESEFKINGVYLPKDAFLYCPECRRVSVVKECDGWPTCPVHGATLALMILSVWTDPLTHERVYLKLSPITGQEKTAKITRIIPGRE